MIGSCGFLNIFLFFRQMVHFHTQPLAWLLESEEVAKVAVTLHSAAPKWMSSPIL